MTNVKLEFSRSVYSFDHHETNTPDGWVETINAQSPNRSFKWSDEDKVGHKIEGLKAGKAEVECRGWGGDYYRTKLIGVERGEKNDYVYLDADTELENGLTNCGFL